MKRLVTLAAVLLCSCTQIPSFDLSSKHDILHSSAMGKEMPYSVYTPPNWHIEERLPLLLLLHGARDNERSFDRYQMGAYLDQHISKGALPRLVVLNPNGEMGFWENWHDGSRRYRDWVVKDLMPVIKTQYNTLNCPAHCFVTGISMGGYGAIHLANYEPNTFSSVAALSTPLFNAKELKSKSSIATSILQLFIPTKKIWGDINGTHKLKSLDPYISWVEKESLQSTRLMLAWGDKERRRIKKSNSRFSKHLKQQGRDHTAMIFSGGHKWKYWKPIIAESIKFHTQQEKAISLR